MKILAAQGAIALLIEQPVGWITDRHITTVETLDGRTDLETGTRRSFPLDYVILTARFWRGRDFTTRVTHRELIRLRSSLMGDVSWKTLNSEVSFKVKSGQLTLFFPADCAELASCPLNEFGLCMKPRPITVSADELRRYLGVENQLVTPIGRVNSPAMLQAGRQYGLYLHGARTANVVIRREPWQDNAGRWYADLEYRGPEGHHRVNAVLEDLSVVPGLATGQYRRDAYLVVE